MATERTRTEDAECTRCTICGESRWSFLRQGRDLLRPESEMKFELSRCMSCGHIMQTPPPTDEELRKAYSADYAPYRPAWKESGWPLWKILRALTTWRRMQRLKRYGKGRKLLEVGSGAGDFLYAARKAGWDVRAVEYSDELAETLRTELNFDVRAGDLKPGLWKEGEFDVIILWSVLEHVRDPLETLLIVNSYLKPGGLLFLQIPTAYGIERGKWFGQHWVLLELPRHLNFFGEESLSRLCGEAGMDLILFKTPMLETMWCYLASTCNCFFNATTPQEILRSVLAGVRAILTLPVMALQASPAHGTEAFAIAVKK